MASDGNFNSPLTVLAERRARFSADAPAIRWKTWALATVLLVALAMIFGDSRLTIAARAEPAWLRLLGENTTNFGKSGWILVLSGAIFAAAVLRIRLAHVATARSALDQARAWAISAAFMFLSVALSGIVSNIVKRFIGRARPPLFETHGPFHFEPFSGALYESMPSGHATTDGAIAMSLAILFPKYRVPILIAGAYFALTRIVVGAHYLSDVVAGYSFGMWYAGMSAIVFAMHGFAVGNLRKP
jgi:membrane-associated phospholipid phosphatase